MDATRVSLGTGAENSAGAAFEPGAYPVKLKQAVVVFGLYLWQTWRKSAAEIIGWNKHAQRLADANSKSSRLAFVAIDQHLKPPVHRVEHHPMNRDVTRNERVALDNSSHPPDVFIPVFERP